jgi:hypothetical protein
MSQELRNIARGTLIAALLAGTALNANADVITDWNIKTGEFIVDRNLARHRHPRDGAVQTTPTRRCRRAARRPVDAVAAAYRAAPAEAAVDATGAIEAAYRRAGTIPMGSQGRHRPASRALAPVHSAPATPSPLPIATHAGAYVPTAPAPTWSLHDVAAPARHNSV